MPDYPRWSQRDLERAVARRGLRVDCHARTRRSTRDFIAALQAADASPRTLLSLPNELLLDIARHLLIFHRRPSDDDLAVVPVFTPCHPHILACCKHLNRVATKVLYDENVFDMSLMMDDVLIHTTRTGSYAQYVSTGLKTGRGTAYPVRPTGLRVIRWPGWLLKVKQLRVEVDLHDRAVDHPGGRVARHWYLHHLGVELNHILYSLCSFLAGRGQIRRFVLLLHSSVGGRGVISPQALVSENVEMVISPLAVLGVCDEITIQAGGLETRHFIDSRFTSAAAAQMSPDSKILPKAMALLEEASLYQGLGALVLSDAEGYDETRELYIPPGPTLPPYWAPLNDARAEVLALLDSRSTFNTPTSMAALCDRSWQLSMEAATASLQLAFDNLDVSRIASGRDERYGQVVARMEEWRRDRMAARSKDETKWAEQSLTHPPRCTTAFSATPAELRLMEELKEKLERCRRCDCVPGQLRRITKWNRDHGYGRWSDHQISEAIAAYA